MKNGGMSMSDELQRFTLPEGRVYTDNEELYLPSVSTVLDEMPTPDGIKYWKKKNNGKGDTKHWRTILQYKGNRGTLIHYNLLNEFEDGDMYSVDEEESTEELKLEGDWDRYRHDLVYAQEAWESIKDVRGITEDNVLSVECFVTNTNTGYAGQFDLLYIDGDGNLVLSDLKTSKRIYDKHKMQLVAYDNALNLDIDVLEVIRIHPDTNTYEILHDDEWFEARDHYWDEFSRLRATMDNLEERMDKALEDGVED